MSLRASLELTAATRALLGVLEMYAFLSVTSPPGLLVHDTYVALTFVPAPDATEFGEYTGTPRVRLSSPDLQTFVAAHASDDEYGVLAAVGHCPLSNLNQHCKQGFLTDASGRWENGNTTNQIMA